MKQGISYPEGQGIETWGSVKTLVFYAESILRPQTGCTHRRSSPNSEREDIRADLGLHLQYMVFILIMWKVYMQKGRRPKGRLRAVHLWLLAIRPSATAKSRDV
jgi:hypothetical protein